MTVFDKSFIAEATAGFPDRATKARSKARDIGRHCEWLRLVVEQHEQIEAAFARLRAAIHLPCARRLERELAVLLTGHAIAEEAVLYPAMANANQRAHAVAACSEQSRIKVYMAALERLEPMTPQYRDALGRLVDAVAAHMFDEESSWFPALARTADDVLQRRLSARFVAEYERYTGVDMAAA